MGGGNAPKPVKDSLRPLPADAASKLDVLGHDGDALGVDGTQVSVLEEPHQVGLARLLQRHHGRALKTQVGLEVLRDFAHQPLERQLADQQLRGLLVAPDLAQSYSTGAVAVRLLHAAGGRRAFAGRLGGELFARRLPPVDLRAVCFVRAITSRTVSRKKQLNNGFQDETLYR